MCGGEPLAARIGCALRVHRPPQGIRIDVHRLHRADKQRQYIATRGGHGTHRPGQLFDTFPPVKTRWIRSGVPVLMRASRDRRVGRGGLNGHYSAVLADGHKKCLHADANHLVDGDAEEHKVVVAAILPKYLNREHLRRVKG